MRPRRLARFLGVGGSLVLGLGLLAARPAPVLADNDNHVHTCSGTPQAPGVLAGNFSSVDVKGVCFVNSGPAIVHGELTVEPGGVLVAAFGLNNSSLTVKEDLEVEKGAALLLGCEPGHFTCLDDNPASPSLSSQGRVGDDLTAHDALGVVVHDSWIGGDVTEKGGGGGFNCNPSPIFGGNPVFSAYEDSTIRGDVKVTGLTSCWLGLARDHIGGDLRLVNNQLADNDAIEILANHISEDLVCRGNSMVWDNAEAGPSSNPFPRAAPQPNIVGDDRVGQCLLSSPTTMGGAPGPGPF